MNIISINPEVLFSNSLDDVLVNPSQVIVVIVDLELINTEHFGANIVNLHSGLEDNLQKRLLHYFLSKFVKDFSLNQLEINPYGKPYIKNSNIQFNITHSKSKYAIAISENTKLGIDIEHINPNKRVLEIAKRFFCKNEFDELLSMENNFRISSFFEMWTKKESLVKCLGFQMYNNMDKIDTVNNKWQIDKPFSKIKQLYYSQLKIDKLYKMSLSCSNSISKVIIFNQH